MSRNLYDSSNDTLTPLAGYQSIDSALSDTSGNPVMNRVVKAALDTKADTNTVNTQIQGLTSFVGKKLSAQTLAVGNTTLTFTDESITTNSTIEEYYSIRGVAATEVVPTAGKVVMTFEPLDTALSVYLIIR